MLKKTFLATMAIAFFMTMASSQTEPVGCHHFKKDKHRSYKWTDKDYERMQAGLERSDTFDVLHYDITADVTNFADGVLTANTTVYFRAKMDDLTFINLDLQGFVIDSVKGWNQHLTYDKDSLLLTVHFPSTMMTDDEGDVTVWYRGQPIRDPVWGGFYFEGGYAYNLGIGLSSIPPNYGRAWYPAFDNFVEKSTYDYHIVSSAGRRGFAVGTFLGENLISGDTIVRSFHMGQQIPTYLSHMACSKYEAIRYDFQGLTGTIPVELLAKAQDTANMRSSFTYLPDAIEAFEYWYGPYQWERVGYTATTVGAMEHPTRIAYPDALLNGNPFDNNRLMAHELGHLWWGDYTTPETHNDMWLKEGPAEYCAHLFIEWTFGHDEFVRTVKSNFLNVMRQAHIDDGAFHPLSGIPDSVIYGTHTYNKGAAMLHNLRGYMGDQLFRQSMQSVLNAFPYQNINAYTFRDQLSQDSGIDLTSFFDDWIFAPGYSAFDIDSIHIVPDGVDHEITVFTKQRLYEAPHYHTNVPMDVVCFDENWDRYVGEIMVSGQSDQVTFVCPFNPQMMVLNETNRLNQARVQTTDTLRSTGYKAIYNTDFAVSVETIEDSALISVEHYWTAPEPNTSNTYIDKMSSTHYWSIDGIFPDVFEAQARIQYMGSVESDFDYDLTNSTEDSLILVYRRDASQEWAEYDDYTKIPLTPSDGRGFIRIDVLRKGDYAFANGYSPTVSTESIIEDMDISLSPNPASSVVKISSKRVWNNSRIEIYDVDGKLMSIKKLNISNSIDIATGSWPAGIYYAVLFDQKNQLIESKQFEIIH